MKTLRTFFAAFVMTLPLAYVTTPVQAASAHNSQAGADGPTSNNAAPTGRHYRN